MMLWDPSAFGPQVYTLCLFCHCFVRPKSIQGTWFKRQEVASKLPAHPFKGNISSDAISLGNSSPCSFGGLITDRHVQFPQHVNLKRECYFFPHGITIQGGDALLLQPSFSTCHLIMTYHSAVFRQKSPEWGLSFMRQKFSRLGSMPSCPPCPSYHQDTLQLGWPKCHSALALGRFESL